MPTFAAVDVGANSVRLSVARFGARGRREVLHEDREVTRLGAAVFRTGRLAPDAMAATVAVLRRYRRAIQRLHVDAVRVVATSALRDAANARVLIDWVRSATGWSLEVISGVEEGRLIHLGVMSQARLRSSRVLLVDLGGGSCEFTVSVDRHIRQIYSLPLGAVRLTGEFLRRDPPKKKELARLEGYIGEQVARIAPAVRKARVQQVIATSGSAAALADLNHAPTVTRAQTGRIFRQLSRLEAAARTRLRGVGPRRAEIIVAGVAVFAELLSRLGLPSFRYLPLGLRDGVLAQMAAERDQRHRRELEAERLDALAGLGRHFAVDDAHANHVRKLALELFRTLRPLHELPREYADWIGAAALTYEAGNYLNRSGGRRHSQYIIEHSEIFGFTPTERRLIAAIARYQGGAQPASDQIFLRRAVVLLRLARALDQGRRGAVQSLRVRIERQQVVLKLHARPEEGELELWALEKESGYFREVFGRALTAQLTTDN